MSIFRKKVHSDNTERVIELTIIKGNYETGDIPGKRFDLQRGDNVIGRDQLCDVVLGSRTVSRRHAKIKVSHDKQLFTIEDLDSANGVIIGSGTVLKKTSHILKSTDQFQIGDIVLRIMAIDQSRAVKTMMHLDALSTEVKKLGKDE